MLNIILPYVEARMAWPRWGSRNNRARSREAALAGQKPASNGNGASFGDPGAEWGQEDFGRDHIEVSEHLLPNGVEQLGMRQRDASTDADDRGIVRVGDRRERDAGGEDRVVDNGSCERVVLLRGLKDQRGSESVEDGLDRRRRGRLSVVTDEKPNRRGHFKSILRQIMMCASVRNPAVTERSRL